MALHKNSPDLLQNKWQEIVNWLPCFYIVLYNALINHYDPNSLVERLT